jgi:type IV pilus assembly protein PilO
LYRALSSAAEQVGLGVSLFQPREARAKDVVSEIPITLTAEGSYHQLAKFFERVAGLPRVVTVNDFKMSGLAKAKNSMRADMTLATYMYRAGAAAAPKPGAPAAPKPAASLPGSTGDRS